MSCRRAQSIGNGSTETGRPTTAAKSRDLWHALRKSRVTESQIVFIATLSPRLITPLKISLAQKHRARRNLGVDSGRNGLDMGDPARDNPPSDPRGYLEQARSALL